MKMILFDIDGTLLLTGGVGGDAFDRAFEEIFGIPEIWGNTQPHGKTDPMIIEEIVKRALDRKLTRKEYRLLCESYIAHFSHLIKKAPRFRLMPGILKLLPLLKARKKDFLLGLATGNFESASWMKLQRGNIHRYFQFGGFGSDSHNRTALTRMAIKRGKAIAGHRFKKKDIFIIGDTEKDIRVAKEIGVPVIAVATGGHTRQELKRYKPDFLLNNLTAIRKFFAIIDKN